MLSKNRRSGKELLFKSNNTLKFGEILVKEFRLNECSTVKREKIVPKIACTNLHHNILNKASFGST